MQKNDAVILAAGKGSRFHSQQYKLLTPVAGKPMILKTLEPVIEAGFDEIIVVIGSHALEMRETLRDLPVRIVENINWEKGQSSSLAAGIRALSDNSVRTCFLLGDQPFIQTNTLKQLLSESICFPKDVIVPFYNGQRANPIIVPAYRYALMLELTSGDVGGRKMLEMIGYHSLTVADPGVIHDIDTIEELKQNG